jgi:TolB protein
MLCATSDFVCNTCSSFNQCCFASAKASLYWVFCELKHLWVFRIGNFVRSLSMKHRSINHSSLLLATCFAICTLLTSAGAFAQVVADVVRPKAGAIPIAVVPFGWSSAGISDTDVAAIIRSDLDRTGQFVSLRSDRYIEMPNAATEIKFDTWRLLKQNWIVVGRVLDAPNNTYRVEFSLHAVGSQKQELGVALISRPNDLRAAAHQIADQIYEKITGVRGAFSTRIAYVTSTGLGKNRTYKLIVADSDGYNPTAMVTSREPLLSPAWSPDSRRLAYVSFERGNSAIYLHELATGARRLLSSSKGINGAPAFSPDGTRMALTLSRTGNPEIYTMDLASGALTQITRSFSIDTEAVWMPGGQQILFTSDRGGRPQVYRMNADGSNVQRITFEGTENARASVSADGKRIVVAQGQRNIYSIAMIDRERGEPGSVSLVSRGKYDECPSFAPNGQMILYAARAGGRGYLVASSVDGNVTSKLQIAEGDVREPAWSPFRR